MERDRNFEVFLDSVIQKKCRLEHKPVQLMLGLTNACNLHCAFCPYCGFCEAKIEMVHMMPLELLEKLKPYLSSARYTAPSGRGEPFLYKDFEQFLEICRECDALKSMQLTTNGTQMQRHDLSRLEGINIIAVSVDSVDSRTFEILRYGAKLDQVLDNVKKMRAALPNTVLQWSVVVNRLNMTQLADIYRKAKEYGIDYITFHDIYGEEENKVIQLLRLRASDKQLVEEQFQEMERLNADGKLVINNLMMWDGFEDGQILDRNTIFQKLDNMKSMEPYLDYDHLDCKTAGSRRIKTENRKKLDDTKIILPYCVQPFEAMLIQPDQKAEPCCSSFGKIDEIRNQDINAVWNGRNYQELREAMFNWDMLPDYCRSCRSFARYDYLADIWKRIRQTSGYLERGGVRQIQLPPNYMPPDSYVKDEQLAEMIKEANASGKRQMQMITNTNKMVKKMNRKNETADDLRQIAKPETWDRVAEAYQVELEDGEQRLADDIEKILRTKGLKPGDSLIEMGCGSGHLSLCLAQKGYQVTLVDFSQTALEKARQTFERYGENAEFILGDLFQLDEKIPVHDFAWNSGVMEHFGDHEIVTLMTNIGRFAKKGVLYLVPNSTSIAYLLMRARLMADDAWIYGEEYLRHDYDVILKKLGYQEVTKEYVITAAASAYQIWKAQNEQGTLSELYKMLAQEQMLPQEEGYLAAYYASDLKLDGKQEETYAGTAAQETRIFDLTAVKIGYQELKKQSAELALRLQEMETEQSRLETEHRELETEHRKLEVERKNSEEEIKRVKSEIYAVQNQLYKSELENKNMQTDLENRTALLQQKDACIRQIQSLCHCYASTKLSRLNHFIIRLRVQYLRGSREDKQAFFKWLKGKAAGTNVSVGDGYRFNPWMDVYQKLQETLERTENNFNKHTANTPGPAHKADGQHTELSKSTKTILRRPYTKHDVIIFSVIDFDFRFQRPQHFAVQFAENGHRVFYINANFINPSSVRKKQDNLYIVNWNHQKISHIYAADWRKDSKWLYQALDKLLGHYAVRDAITIVDYPNWVIGADYLREKYGFKIVTDYMDDYTGFLGTAEKFLKENCEKLLRTSDLVAASSSFLYDIAERFTDKEHIALIRNGTQTQHFQKALSCKQHRERKVIGYYGAVSHWFAYEKVCYVADALPECEVVIIGEVTAHRHALEKRRNITLLGEMEYQKLPEHLAYFDVCLIPFDTGTDLIRATNPVKFYEYLSAGKKIVATEIPELEPYRDTYVYMSNDNKKFLEYVKLCLEQKDSLKPAEECIRFARQNDWQERFKSFAAACKKHVPKVSVVVLTYNNEAMNRQCIESIFNKTAYPNYELIVVDNASTDGTRAYLQELDAQQRDNVKVIFNEENLGFAAGNNCGIKAADGTYVILLNNDTVVTRGWMTSLVKHLENNAGYAMCNPVTNAIGNESKIAAEYHNATELEQFSYSYTKEHIGEEYRCVDRLPLFATVIRKSVLDEVGMLDEAYKVGMFEDDDLTEKVRQAGYRIVIAEDAFIHHIQRASFRKLEDEAYRKVFEENREIYERKWEKKWRMPKYREGVDAGTGQECVV